MFRIVVLSIVAIVTVGCASVDRLPSMAYSTIEASDIAFDRDLFRIEAPTIFEVADVQVDVYDSAWQVPWQDYVFDEDALTVEEAERLDDEFYELPIWRASSEVVDDIELKDKLGDTFGADIQLLYRAPKTGFNTEVEAQTAYLEIAKAFYTELEAQNDLLVSSSDRQKVEGSQISQKVRLFDNDLKMSAYDKGERITTTQTDSDFYVSGLLFDPKMKALDGLMANIRKSHEQFLDAAISAYLAVADENFFLVLGQSPTIRMPPGVVDASGTFMIAHSYRDGADLQLPVELFLYRSRQLVSDLID